MWNGLLLNKILFIWNLVMCKIKKEEFLCWIMINLLDGVGEWKLHGVKFLVLHSLCLKLFKEFWKNILFRVKEERYYGHTFCWKKCWNNSCTTKPFKKGRTLFQCLTKPIIILVVVVQLELKSNIRLVWIIYYRLAKILVNVYCT